MGFSTHIKTLVLAVVFTGFGAATVSAADLTPEERNVCPSLSACVDIIRRHEAGDFDYQVLEAEFRRFGPAGRKALMDVLNSKAGNPDIARIIANTGPLNAAERTFLQKNWSLDRAELYLPFLLDGHPLSRDLLLRTLSSDTPEVREQARLALIRLPQPVVRQPVSQNLAKPLLAALAKDPVAEAAPYISRLNPQGNEAAFGALLSSGEPALVLAAYQALYRQNPANAFKTLLSEMGRVNSAEQARAIGEMLVVRNRTRADGFYLKFAVDISGDLTRPVPARAAGLHAVLVSEQSKMPEFTPARAEALRFLVSGHPFVTQDQYLPQLARLKAEDEFNLIWRIATEEKWINRDRIAAAFVGLKSWDQVIADLLRADDFRTFSAGATLAKPNHAALLRVKLNHPLKDIQDLTRKKLKLPASQSDTSKCIISKFDSNDQMNQMPFFDSAWMKADNNSRVVLERKYLTAAHPGKTGWLAGYDLQGVKSIFYGGSLVYFDNKTGASKQIGNFSGPLAILPNRSLRLGETTNRFWVIDRWGGDSADISVYSVELTAGAPGIRHLGTVPDKAQDFSVAPNGDLLVTFEDGIQAPIRMSPRGEISLACRPSQPVTATPAPN